MDIFKFIEDHQESISNESAFRQDNVVTRFLWKIDDMIQNLKSKTKLSPLEQELGTFSRLFRVAKFKDHTSIKDDSATVRNSLDYIKFLQNNYPVNKTSTDYPEEMFFDLSKEHNLSNYIESLYYTISEIIFMSNGSITKNVYTNIFKTDDPVKLLDIDKYNKYIDSIESFHNVTEELTSNKDVQNYVLISSIPKTYWILDELDKLFNMYQTLEIVSKNDNRLIPFRDSTKKLFDIYYNFIKTLIEDLQKIN